MKKNILILYYQDARKLRKTIDDHLYSFKRYCKNSKFHYLNTIFGIPRYLTIAEYDGVILHYTLFAMRWNEKQFPKYFKSLSHLKRIKGYKVGIPQDEYAKSDQICRIMKTYGVKTVFTRLPSKLVKRLYPPEKVDLDYSIRILLGQVDELLQERVEQWLVSQKSRKIDIGYRARKVPFWLGKKAQQKYEVGEVFKKYCKKYPQLKTDISSNPKDVILKDHWIRFLLNCKAVLGSEGGSGISDPDGSIRKEVENFIKSHPNSGHEEIEKKILAKKNSQISFFSITPRHFEAAMTKTCQILLEGEYSGIMKPDVHYIAVKSDYSNLDNVIKKFKNEKYRKRIIDRAYKDLVLSKKYTYRKFANSMISHIIKQQNKYKKEFSFNDSVIFFIVGLLALIQSQISLFVKVIFDNMVVYKAKLFHQS